MKTTHTSILAVVSLSLALCACDNGDKKDTTSAPPAVPMKKPKADGGDAKGNPQPPESTETAKPMNPGGAPAAAGEATEVPADESLKYLNGMVQMYNQKQSGGQMAMRSMNMKDPKAAQRQYEEAKKKTAGNALTSLDQLVTSGIIKKLPDAPAGKKFVLDAKTQTVRLE